MLFLMFIFNLPFSDSVDLSFFLDSILLLLPEPAYTDDSKWALHCFVDRDDVMIEVMLLLLDCYALVDKHE